MKVHGVAVPFLFILSMLSFRTCLPAGRLDAESRRKWKTLDSRLRGNDKMRNNLSNQD